MVCQWAGPGTKAWRITMSSVPYRISD
jgi:hypothetical protein